MNHIVRRRSTLAAIASLVLGLTVIAIFLVSERTLPASTTWTAFVTAVHDGDTFYVRYSKPTTLPTAIRLYLCDAPELGRFKAADAKKRLEQLVLFKTVTITTYGRRSYDRLLAFATTDDGTNVATTLIAEGLARIEILHPEESAYARTARTLQDRARHNHVGIWN